MDTLLPGPPNVVLEILSYLDLDTLLHCRLVSKSLKQLIDGRKHLWKTHLRKLSKTKLRKKVTKCTRKWLKVFDYFGQQYNEESADNLRALVCFSRKHVDLRINTRIKGYVCINTHGNESRCPLNSTYQFGSTELILMITKVPDKDMISCAQDRDSKSTPIHIACQRERLDHLQLAMDQAETLDYNVNDVNLECQTPFLYACEAGKAKSVKYFLELPKSEGLDYYGEAEGFRTEFNPLFCACSKGQTEIVRILLDYSFDPNYPVDFMKFEDVGTIMFFEAYTKNQWETVKFILNYPMDLQIDVMDRMPSCLFQAVKDGSLDGVKSIMEYLVQKKTCFARIKYHYGNNWQTPLHIACKEGHLDIVQYLVQNKKFKLNVNRKFGKEGKSALEYARVHCCRRQDILDFLTIHGQNNRPNFNCFK